MHDRPRSMKDKGQKKSRIEICIFAKNFFVFHSIWFFVIVNSIIHITVQDYLYYLLSNGYTINNIDSDKNKKPNRVENKKFFLFPLDFVFYFCYCR